MFFIRYPIWLCIIKRAYYLAIDRIVVANCRIPNAMVLLLPVDLKLLHLALFLSPFLVPSLPDSVDYSIYHQKIGGRGYVCNLCGKESKQKVNSINHINSKHISVDYICPLCQYVNKTDAARRMHIRLVHKKSTKYMMY